MFLTNFKYLELFYVTAELRSRSRHSGRVRSEQVLYRFENIKLKRKHMIRGSEITCPREIPAFGP